MPFELRVRLAYDGTVGVDLDPLSLLCRLAAAVPAPRSHTVLLLLPLGGSLRSVVGEARLATEHQ